MFAKTVFLLTIVLSSVILGKSTTVSPCSEDGSLEPIKSVNVTNCDEPPCELKRRTIVKIEQMFVPAEDVQSLTTSAYARRAFLRVPFSQANGHDACEYIYDAEGNFTGCPLTAGTEYYYKNEFRVKATYPQMTAVAEWSLMENRKLITCFKVQAKVVA